MTSLIALDCRPLQDASRYRGIGNVVRHLIPELARLIPNLILLTITEDPKIDNFSVPVLDIPRKKMAHLASFLTQHNVTHIHFTAQYNVPSNFTLSHTITVHDLFTRYRGKNEAKDLAIRLKMKAHLSHANALFAISDFTKNELIETFQFAPDYIHVIYPGAPTHLDTVITNVRPHPEQIPSPYILSIGDFEARKNQNNMIKAVIKLNASKTEKVHYVACIGKGTTVPLPLRWQILRAKQSAYFHFLNFVSDVQLAALYQHTALFCFISKAEGFGLPLLEAMRFNIPILTSNTSSLPELGQDAVAYANPTNITHICHQMAQHLNVPPTNTIIAKRHAILTQFTYANMAMDMSQKINTRPGPVPL